MDKLEKYVINITEPFDFTDVITDSENEIIVEIMETPEGHKGNWNPIPPEHSLGNQHLNVGLDFFAAEKSSSIEVSPSYFYTIVRTGIKMQLPYAYHMMIGSRSGLGFKHHIQAFPGIIDHSYRGEIMIKLYGPTPFEINSGDKVAQGLIFRSQDYMMSIGEVDKNTERGERGFGSTDTPEV